MRQGSQVTSTTLKTAKWNGSEILKGSLPVAIGKLKKSAGDDIVVHGSITLARELLTHDLVDQLNLLVYPVVLGQGKRLFGDGIAQSFDNIATRRFSSGVMALTLRPKQ